LFRTELVLVEPELLVVVPVHETGVELVPLPDVVAVLWLPTVAVRPAMGMTPLATVGTSRRSSCSSNSGVRRVCFAS
jgi:hypothetical protein